MKLLKFLWKVFRVLAALAAGFFAVSFTVYFFNLDMKLTAAIEPLLLGHYENIKRDRHL